MNEMWLGPRAPCVCTSTLMSKFDDKFNANISFGKLNHCNKLLSFLFLILIPAACLLAGDEWILWIMNYDNGQCFFSYNINEINSNTLVSKFLLMNSNGWMRIFLISRYNEVCWQSINKRQDGDLVRIKFVVFC